MAKIATVEFRQDTIFTIERDDGVFVAINPICRTLGVRSEKQIERIKSDPILSEGYAVVAYPSAGGEQETFVLRLDLVNGWLFTIDESRVKDEETRQRVLVYKRECYKVLFQHFHPGAAADAEPDDSLTLSERRQLVAETRMTFDTAAAREMWFKMKLPVVPAMLRDPAQATFFDYAKIKQPPEPLAITG